MPVRSRLEPDRDLVSQELRSSDEISQLALDVENFRDAVMILGRQRPYRWTHCGRLRRVGWQLVGCYVLCFVLGACSAQTRFLLRL